MTFNASIMSLDYLQKEAATKGAQLVPIGIPKMFVLLKTISVSLMNGRVRDLFHVYLNKFEFQFLRLHMNRTRKFCFLINDGRVTGTTK